VTISDHGVEILQSDYMQNNRKVEYITAITTKLIGPTSYYTTPTYSEEDVTGYNSHSNNAFNCDVLFVEFDVSHDHITNDGVATGNVTEVSKTLLTIEPTTVGLSSRDTSENVRTYII